MCEFTDSAQKRIAQLVSANRGIQYAWIHVIQYKNMLCQLTTK